MCVLFTFASLPTHNIALQAYYFFSFFLFTFFFRRFVYKSKCDPKMKSTNTFWPQKLLIVFLSFGIGLIKVFFEQDILPFQFRFIWDLNSRRVSKTSFKFFLAIIHFWIDICYSFSLEENETRSVLIWNESFLVARKILSVH